MDINKKDINLLTKEEFDKIFTEKMKERQDKGDFTMNRDVFLLTLLQKRILNPNKMKEFQ